MEELFANLIPGCKSIFALIKRDWWKKSLLTRSRISERLFAMLKLDRCKCSRQRRSWIDEEMLLKWKLDWWKGLSSMGMLHR